MTDTPAAPTTDDIPDVEQDVLDDASDLISAAFEGASQSGRYTLDALWIFRGQPRNTPDNDVQTVSLNVIQYVLRLRSGVQRLVGFDVDLKQLEPESNGWPQYRKLAPA